MQQHYTFECDCGKQHTSTSTATPSGWQIGRDGKPVCDDCTSAVRTRRHRRAAWMTSNDARELQPKARTLDLSHQGTGQPFYAVIQTSPYHSIDPAKVYPQLLTVRFRARDFDHAADFAKAMATIIQIGHDVHRATVKEVGETKFDHVTRPAERPVVGA